MAQVKRCAACGKFQKFTTQMTIHNGKEICPACAAKLHIAAKVIEAGPRGVTKNQMIPAIKANLNNEAVLKQLVSEYPTVFHGSLRYLHKADMMKVQEIVGAREINDEQAKLIAVLKPSRKGITYNQILHAVRAAKEANDKHMVKLIKKYYGDLLAKCSRYLRKDYKEFAEV